MNDQTLKSGIEIKHEGELVILLNVPATLTQEQAQELLAGLGGALDEDYAYHLGQRNPPLPYAIFKTKKKRLDYLLAREPRDPARDPSLPEINKLCRELGY